MRARSLLILTAIVSSLLGAVVAWLVLTVPNDLAGRRDDENRAKGRRGGTQRQSAAGASRIIQQYPRTDAAAAATVALATIADSERHALAASIDAMRKTSDAQQKQIADLTARVDTLAAAPPPQPVAVQAPRSKEENGRPSQARRKRRR